MTSKELDMILDLWNKPIDVLYDLYNGFEEESERLLNERKEMTISEDNFERQYNESQHNKWILINIISKTNRNARKEKLWKERNEVVDELCGYKWYGNEEDEDYKEEYSYEYSHLLKKIKEIDNQIHNL